MDVPRTMTGNAVLRSALVLVLLTGVRSQVCTKTVKRQMSGAASDTAVAKMCGKCPLRVISRTQVENAQYNFTVYECCPGYEKKIQTLDPSSDNCVPLNCKTQCVNGRCSTQDECECYAGYEKHPTQNTCIPKCNAGFIRESDICVPHCSKPCHGGRCVAPDMCSCNEGWALNEREGCIQVNTDPKTCHPPCGNGTCNGNRCTCWHGYEFNENTTLRCVPICRNCQGHCVAPGRCECPEYQERKYLRADGRDCDCSEDCNTKCHKTICVPATTTSTPIPQTPMDPSYEPNDTEFLEVYVVDEPTTKLDTRCAEPVKEVKYNEESFATAFYLSAVANIILIIIIIGIIFKKKIYAKCKTGAGEIKKNVSETNVHYTDMTGARQNSRELQKYEYIPKNAVPGCSDQYVPMGDVNRNKLADPHQYESIQYSKCAGAGETLCYDYV